jgi:hypothetical protein
VGVGGFDIGLGSPGLGLRFRGMQRGIGKNNGLRGGPCRSGGHSPGLSGANAESGSSSAGNGSAKKDEEDFNPAVLNDVAGWQRTLRLHKYTPNFKGISWKEMAVMGDQVLEAQGVAVLDARKKMLTFEAVVRRKIGIDDPTAPPGGLAPFLASTLGSSAGSGGGMLFGVKYDLCKQTEFPIIYLSFIRLFVSTRAFT